MTLKTSLLVALAMLTSALTHALPTDVSTKVTAVMPKVVAWRRDFHEHPELSNQEFRTAEIVANHLRALGMDVETEVAH
ncbi:MAG: amidohydrolase, partial [Luminiphilus sp.]|nr:amidohydrolase [Luminiphilus sp.]